jgi:CII-binding regulator of phage lambda lysogenization HflD
VTAPTAGHQGYAPALPFQHNAFGALAGNDSDEDDSAETVTTQMAALTYQSQLTASTAANLSQQMGQYIQTLAHQQDLLHQNQHQIMEQMAALSFNQSDAGRGISRPGRGQPHLPPSD